MPVPLLCRCSFVVGKKSKQVTSILDHWAGSATSFVSVSFPQSHPKYTVLTSTGWSLLALPLFCFPTNAGVTLETMNYAVVVFVGFLLISAVWYGVWGRKNYVGPALESLEGRNGSLSHDNDSEAGSSKC